MRGEWAGIAVNLRTKTPTVEALQKAVGRVLSETDFKVRCTQIQRENEQLNCLVQLEKLIDGKA
jgi:UDP:flavonoid glycosyltransferase YjiC (YdhE family)